MPTESSVAMHATERRAAAIAVAVGFVLMAVKFVAWRLTGSSAVYSDALESIINVVASGFALWAISQAHRPADRTHPYGHGRFEFVADVM
jgi:cation diffusion facilitator family transporter